MPRAEGHAIACSDRLFDFQDFGFRLPCAPIDLPIREIKHAKIRLIQLVIKRAGKCGSVRKCHNGARGSVICGVTDEKYPLLKRAKDAFPYEPSVANFAGHGKYIAAQTVEFRHRAGDPCPEANLFVSKVLVGVDHNRDSPVLDLADLAK